MKPNVRFLNRTPEFWAYVRAISEKKGYVNRGEGTLYVPHLSNLCEAIEEIGFSSVRLRTAKGEPTSLSKELLAYFKYRARVLEQKVEPLLMNVKEAKQLFRSLKRDLSPNCPLPDNKQRGEKKGPAYFTCVINMLIEANVGDQACDFDPRKLTKVTHKGVLHRTLSRRVDGAFPSTVDPLAIWEIKEYYYTTTFGSRVADAVYETLLDGMELCEIYAESGQHIKHYLMIDSHYTWWECGKSYLCRIVDLLHMGYVDEVLFGREVVDRLPSLCREWVCDI